MTRRFVVVGILLAVFLGVLVIRPPGLSPLQNQDAIEKIRRNDLAKVLAEHPEIAKPMKSYRVHEEKKAEGLVHRGGGYVAQTTPQGLHFEAGGSFIELRAVSLEQGDRVIACQPGAISNPSFGDVRIDRGCLIEQYVFENSRTEQIFRIPQPIADGALRVSVSVRTDLSGKVTQVRRTDGGWLDSSLQDGGLAFADSHGDQKIVYHGAMAVDAGGRRTDLNPTYADGKILLEVPQAFMQAATYPVAIDPWLELNFSASGGGLSNSTLTSQTPSVVVVGGGNPWVAWSEQVPVGNTTHFQIFFRYWNGFNWTDLGGSGQGSGMSGTTGNATNPSLASGQFGPDIAWQDDTTGTSDVFFKRWTGSTWQELSSTTPNAGNPTTSSASPPGGISFGIGTFSGFPSLDEMFVTVPSTGKGQVVPVISYESTNPGPMSIITAAWFPGDPGAAEVDNVATGAVISPNFPVIPQGWYGLGAGDSASQYAFIQMSNTPAGFVSQKPSLKLPGGSPGAIVAWEDTRNNTHDIMVARYTVTGFPGGANRPLFPQSRSPDFAYGTWAGLGASFNPGGLTNNPAGNAIFSITPSLDLDSSGNPGVAWEQFITPGNLNDSDIYFQKWNGGAWVALAGSSSGNGISQTPGTISATPSVAIEGDTAVGTIYVAWQDDQAGNSEIYVRRFRLGTSVAWEEVGFQSNSASVGPTPGIGGISKTTSASLKPSIGSNGGPTVAWQDFNSGTPQIYVRRFFQNEPLFLRQTDITGTTVIPFGGNTNGTTIDLRGTAFSEDPNRLVAMQVEVVPVGTPFVGRVTQQSNEVTIGGPNQQGTQEMVVQFTGLENVSYVWQARTVDDLGQTSAWFLAGGAGTPIDFTVSAVSTVPPGAPTTLTVALVNGVVTLSWTAPAGGTDSYNVKRSTVMGGGGYPPATIISVSGAVTGTTFSDLSTTPGVTYFYVVSAVRGGLEGPNSNEVSIAVPAGAGGAGGGPDNVSKKRCGLLGGEALLALAGLVLFSRRRRT